MSQCISLYEAPFGRRHFIAVAAFAVLVSGISASAFAEGNVSSHDGDDSADEALDKEVDAAGEGTTVRTTEGQARWREDERFASGMTTRVPTDDLTLRAETVGDALSRVTGTYVRRKSSYGQPAHLSIRGGNPRQVVVDLDGLRLSAPAGTGFDIGTMMPQGLKSADLIRGAAASSRGGGAPTGALQLNPASASDHGVTVRGRLMGGSFGTAATEAQLGAGNGKGGLLVYGGVRHSDGDFAFVDHRGESQRRLNNDHQRSGLGATAHLESGSHSLRLTTRVESGQAGSPGPSEFQQAFRRADIDDRRSLATLRWDVQDLWSNSSTVADAYVTAGVHDYHMDYANEAGFLSGDPFWSRSSEQTAAATAGLQAFVGDSHLLRLDAEGRFASFESQLQTPSRSEDLRAHRQTLAVSASDEWLLLDERLSLLASLRTEMSRDDHGVDEVRPLLPALGLVGRLPRGFELRANIARTYRRPHFDELYLETETMRGDADLDSEDALVFDAGVHWEVRDDRLEFQIAAFQHSIDSMILFLPASAYHFEARNLRGATSRGLETSTFIELTSKLTIDGGYTYTGADLDRSGDEGAPQLPGQPRHRLHLAPAMELRQHSPSSSKPGVKFRSALQYRSSIYLDNFGHLKNSPALHLDAGADIALSEDLRLGLELQNLFDHRSAVDALQQPLPGRAFYVSMEMAGTRR